MENMICFTMILFNMWFSRNDCGEKPRLCALSKCLPGQPALRLRLQFKHVASRWRSSNENVLVLPYEYVDPCEKHVRFKNTELLFSFCILDTISEDAGITMDKRTFDQ